MSPEPDRNRLMRSSAAMLALSLSAALLGACSAGSMIEMLRPYRMDVRQGNYVSQEMLAQLTPGMTRERVRLIMGSPLLVDAFHQDRWDYVYLFTPGRGEKQERRVALIFEEDKLVRVEGDVVAASGDARSDTPAVPRVIEIEPPPAAKP